MKTIDNYILERLNPRHLGSTNRFPIDGTYKKVVDFLKEHRFKEIDIQNDKLNEACLVFNKEYEKCFSQDEEFIIMFADTTREEISENNPLYYMYLIDSRNNTWIYHRWCGIKEPVAVISKNVFEKEINEHFDW
jgi:hypothetical protein